MINSVTDTMANVTQIRTKTSNCISEVDFEHTLMQAVSVNTDEGTQGVSGKMTLSQIFQAASEKYNIPLNLLKAVVKQESDFNNHCVSHAGAQGLMQLMPETARSLGVTDSFDAWQNVMGGAKYLSQKLKMYQGNVRLALAAYNAGSGNVAKYGGIPPFKETQDYVRKVLSYMKQDITIPNKTVAVSVSETNSAKVSAKRQAKANGLELLSKDGNEGKQAVSPVQTVVSHTENVSESIKQSLKLYEQEQKKASLGSIMEKLLFDAKNKDNKEISYV